MKKKKMMTALTLTSCIIVLSLLGGQWGNAFAQTIPITIPTTVPTVEPPRSVPAPVVSTPYPAVKGNTGYGKDVMLRYQDWGGVLFPNASSCGVGAIAIFRIPIIDVKARDNMSFYREVLDARYYDKGVPVQSPQFCGVVTLFYELTPSERNIYDQTPDKIGIFIYDEQLYTWHACNIEVVEEIQSVKSKNGFMTCEVNHFSFFALAKLLK